MFISVPMPILSSKSAAAPAAPSSGIPFIPWRSRSRAPQPQPAKNETPPFRLRWQRTDEAGRRSSPPPPLPENTVDLAGWTWHCTRSTIAQRPYDPPCEISDHGRSVHFYRRVSSGTAGARLMQPVNNGRYYWELHLGERMFGTSIMVGVATDSARADCYTFKNLIGEDEHGWGLSHKGVAWHCGQWSPYCDPFPQNSSTVVGVLFDGIAGTLGFFKDGVWLGVAFTGLDKVSKPLYPMVSCTARNTRMTLVSAHREVGSLMERSRAAVLRNLPNYRDVRYLPLPAQMRSYILSGVSHPVTLPATNPAHRLLI